MFVRSFACVASGMSGLTSAVDTVSVASHFRLGRPSIEQGILYSGPFAEAIKELAR